MPLWYSNETHCVLAMPTLFLKPARKRPQVYLAQPLIWSSSNSKRSLGGQGSSATPEDHSFPWDCPRIQESCIGNIGKFISL